jgi:hypothetical protein
MTSRRGIAGKPSPLLSLWGFRRANWFDQHLLERGRHLDKDRIDGAVSGEPFTLFWQRATAETTDVKMSENLFTPLLWAKPHSIGLAAGGRFVPSAHLVVASLAW